MTSQVKLLPAVLTSHYDPSLSSTSFISDSAAYHCTLESGGSWPNSLDLATHMEDPEEAVSCRCLRMSKDESEDIKMHALEIERIMEKPKNPMTNWVS